MMLGTLEVTTEALGHVSARVGTSNEFLIKGKGVGEVGLRYTTERDVILVDFDGKKVAGEADLQPPSECFIHSWLYRKRHDVGCVVHMHPEDAVLLSICEKPLLPVTLSGARFLLKPVPTYPRSVTIHNDQLGEEFANTMGVADCCIMRGHGITVVGRTVQEATVRTLQFVEMTRTLRRAYLLGDPRPISDADLEFLRTAMSETNRSRGTGGGDASVQSNWRYYHSLALERSGNRANPAGG
jgi:ribulose-5-phosphate 4-epimerase/fuculose-1-phosphate aldolase